MLLVKSNAVGVGATAPAPTALDLTKTVNVLSGGAYSLANGAEGQIMYFVPASGISNGAYIEIANARVIDTGSTFLPIDVTDYMWEAFAEGTDQPRTISMAIFANGAWCLRGGLAD